MNNSNRFKITTAATLILAVALLNIPRPASATLQPTPITGEQIFRGVLFGEAPVSQLIPEVWASDEVIQGLDTTEKVLFLNDLKEQVVAQINDDDPNFMTYFGEEMQSGDQVRIEAILAQASQKSLTTIQNLGYVDSLGHISGNNPMAGLYIYVVGFVVVAAAVVAVVFVAAFAAVRFPHSITTEEETLYREFLVNLIAERLVELPH